MSLVLQSSGGGQITIQEPTTASNFTQTLPAATGTVALTDAPTFTGQVVIPTINLTGGQIVFPATQSASANANTLDDYEEGTWTPTDASGAGLSFTVFGTARYVKIGRLVFFSVDQLNYPATANASSASIGGLPFTNNANNTGGINPVANNANADAMLVVANATNMFFYPAGVLTAATNVSLSGANIYGISGCYQVP